MSPVVQGRLDQTTVSRHALKLKMVSLDGLSLQGLAQMSMSLSGADACTELDLMRTDRVQYGVRVILHGL